jgi:hypothetical protein
MTPRVRDIQFSQILQALKPSISPQESLDKSQSIFKRSRSTRLPEPEQREISRSLEEWFSSPKPSIFLLRVGPRAEKKAKELTAEVISLLRSKSFNVAWRVSPISWSAESVTSSISEVLKALVYQILQLDPSVLCDLDELVVAKFSTMHTEAEWVFLLQKLFHRISRCYVVVETHDLFQANQNDDSWAPRFLRVLYALADHATQNGDVVKFLIVCYGSRKDVEVETPRGMHHVSAVLRRPTITPVSRKHTAMHQKRGKGWRWCPPKI